MIKAVIFDMDGTMFDTETIWGDCWTPVLRSFGYDYPEGLKEACRGAGGDSSYRIIEQYVGHGCDPKAIREALNVYANKIFDQGISKKKGLDNLLKYLKNNHIKLAVASSSDYDRIVKNLELTNTTSYFDVLVSGSFVTKNKPAPDIFLETAKRLGCKPDETIVIEDSFNGIRAGNNGNFITYMVPDLALPDEEIKSLADGIYNDLDEVKIRIDELIKGENK